VRILLLGSHGQVGWELRRALACLGELVALDRHTEPERGDLAQPDRLVETVRAVRPQVIVNAAGYTAVDRAETETALAFAINAAAPAALAREAAALGAWLLQYSSDYVFDGSGDTPRDEDAPTGPLSAYGRSKVAGEAAIRASGCRHLILRTSWIHAARGDNFPGTVLRLAAERERLSVVVDQIGAPTGADLVADVSAHLLRVLRSRPDLGGTYHLAAAGETSRHRYARYVVGWARDQGHPLRLAPEGVVAVPSAAYPTPARRPLNSRLDTRRLRAAFGVELPAWQQGVERMLAERLGADPLHRSVAR
jgi:dTDP-4-dehydrorhamnose reductase